MRNLIAACLLIAVSSIAFSIFTQTQINKCADKKVEVAGVIRSKDENGWFVINDGRHTSLNIDRVEVKQGYIIISTDERKSSYICLSFDRIVTKQAHGNIHGLVL